MNDHFCIFYTRCLQFDLRTPDTMYEPHLLNPSQERPRSTRSHSLKPISQPIPNILTQRKRLYSLPSKPVIPPHITIQACQDSSQESLSDEEEQRSRWSHESMAWYTPVVGLSCSLLMYLWSCALAYYSSTWLNGNYLGPEGNLKSKVVTNKSWKK